LSGCAAGYVMRAAYEEARLLWRRQPIDEVLAHESDPSTRAKLELALAARRFAADDLGLNVGGSYTSVATVDAGQVRHGVTAAPRRAIGWSSTRGGSPSSAAFRIARISTSPTPTLWPPTWKRKATIPTCGRPSHSARSAGSTTRCSRRCCATTTRGWSRRSST